MQTWILIRGLIRGQFHWHDFPERLKKARPDDQIICLDIPGNGTRFDENTPWNISSIAKDIQQKVEPYFDDSTTANIHIIAISMGGMIAADLLNSINDNSKRKFKDLHIINTSFANFSTPWQRMRLPALAGLVPKLFTTPSREKAILTWTSNKDSIEPFIDDWIQEAKRHPLTVRNTLAQLIGAGTYKAPLSAPIQNTYLYTSTQDHLVSCECSRAIAHNWNVPLFEHISAGHDLPLDDPDWLIQKILSTQKTINKEKQSSQR